VFVPQTRPDILRQLLVLVVLEWSVICFVPSHWPGRHFLSLMRGMREKITLLGCLGDRWRCIKQAVTTSSKRLFALTRTCTWKRN